MDEVGSYKAQWSNVHGLGEVACLAKRPNGNCVYLKKGHCSIYPLRPTHCREFDCRDVVNAEWVAPRVRLAGQQLLEADHARKSAQPPSAAAHEAASAPQ